MRLTLKTSLIIILSLLLVILLGQGWIAISRIKAIGSNTDDITTNWMPSVKTLAEIKFLTTRLRLDGARIVMTADAGERAQLLTAFQAHNQELEKASKAYQELITGPEERALWTKFIDKWPVYEKLQEQALAEAASGNREKAADLFGSKDVSVFTGAIAALDADIKFNDDGAAQATAEARATVTSALWQTWIVAGIAISIDSFVLAFIVLRVTNPLQKLNNAMGSMARGQLDIQIPGIQRRDEIGDIAQTIGVIRDNAAREALDKQEAALKEEALQATRRRDDMHKLADSFEGAVGEIIEMVSAASTELEAAAHSLTQTARTTQQLSTSVTTASEEASSNVQSVASATEEMATSIREIGRQVETSNNIAVNAVRQAEETDQRIAQLTKAATRISDVSELIQAIAGQTNLLALNATIEAARAGEAGRGFAVVASEVKELAAQTAKATQEISQQIAEIQSATGESVVAIKEIGSTINDMSKITTTIAAAVEEQGMATQEIARNVQQAAAGTAMVASNIDDVNKGAGETGSASAQVLTSAQSLSSESNRLKVEVRKFLETVRAA